MVMAQGGFAWMLVPIGADESAQPLASLRATPSGVLFGAATHPKLPLVAVRPLVDAALDERRDRFALAALPGLCLWASGVISSEQGALKEQFGEEAVEACEAIALHRPRKGHSVLGQGTFRDAKPAW